MRESAALARRLGVRLHTHGSETVEEERFCHELFGVGPTDYFESTGWLGPDVWMAHCVHMTDADIDWLIPHQANLRIIEATAKRLDMPMERVIVTVDRHGNTSSGSVPLALDEAVRSGKVQRGQLLLLEAFGGGFTWGSALLRY